MGERPRLLDLFSGAGGACRGYQMAGFHVTGVDIAPQPRYVGERFIQADALAYLREHGHEYDAIHASPPCQHYSVMRNLPWLKGKDYPALIDPTRELLNATGRPWVIENVMGAKLAAGFLCGTMFGKRFYRHRAFEVNWLWLAPPHLRHRVHLGRHPGRGQYFVWTDEVPTGVDHPGRLLGPRARRVTFAAGAAAETGRANAGLQRWQSSAIDRNGAGVGVGHAAGAVEARREMGVEWMTRDEMAQAIPPIYCEFVGRQLRTWLEGGG